jgi:hypothetical protein
MWQKLTTRCSVAGSAATFYEDTETDLLDRVTHRIFELRGTRVQYRPDVLTEADRLNGIEARGFADLYYSASREMGLQGPPHQADLIPPLPPHGWSEFRSISDLFERPLRLKMEKRNGKWSFEGWNAFDNKFDVSTVTGNKSSCAALTSPDPFTETAARGRVAGEKANAAARNDAEKRKKLFTQRDLGNALVCHGSRLFTSLDASFGPTIARAVSVKIVGASENAGVLDDLVRVKPLENLPYSARMDELQAVAAGGRTWAGDGFYFVHLGDVKAECPRELVRPQPGLISGIDLAEGVKAAGSLDAWPAYRGRAQNEKQASLDASALSADEFVAKLTSAVQRRGAELEVPPADYQAVTESIGKAVHVCASMSAADYIASLDNLGIPRFRRDSPYFVCFAGLGPSLVSPGSSIVWEMRIKGIRERWQVEQKKWFGPKLQVEVWMRRKSDYAFDKKFILLTSDIRDN